MKKGARNSAIGALVLAAGLALVVIAAGRKQRSIQPHSVAEAETPDVAVSDDLRRFLTLLNTIENEDDPRYLAELEKLHERSTEVIAEARQLLVGPRGNAASDFALRHSVVLAVAALRDPGALDLLSEVALNPLPPAEATLSGGPFAPAPEHRLDTEAAVQATIVALDATDGIQGLAEEGHAEALDALVKAAAAPSNAVRAAALTTLGSRPEWRGHHDKAAASLPDDLRHLAHLSRKAVSEVPQIRDPRVTLLGTGSATTRAPGLGDDSGIRRTRVPGAPRADRR